MFDDIHPGLLAGFCGAVISIILSKVIGVFYVYYKHQEVVESLRVLDDRMRPVLNRMAEYDRRISWTQALDDANLMIPESWYNVRKFLKLHEKINAPTSDIYTIVKVAQLVAAEVAAEAAAESLRRKWEWVLIRRRAGWEYRKVRLLHQSPRTINRPTHTPTFLPPYATNELPNCPVRERQEECGAVDCGVVYFQRRWVWVQTGMPRAEDWVWEWVAVVRSGEWEWQWCRVPPDLLRPLRGGGPVADRHPTPAPSRPMGGVPAGDRHPTPARSRTTPPPSSRLPRPGPGLCARSARSKSAPAARPKSAPRHAVLPLSHSHEELSPPVPLLDENEEEMPYYLHPQGLPPPISSHSRRRRRAGTVAEDGHVDEASASAHPHYH